MSEEPSVAPLEAPTNSPTFITRQVGGVDVKFHPIRLRCYFRLKTIATPVLLALAELMHGGDKDVAITIRDFKDDGSGRVGTEHMTTAIDARLAEVRSLERRNAFKAAIDGIMSESAGEVFAELIMDSLHDFFKPEEASDAKKIKTFANKIQGDVFFEYVAGVIEANKGVFIPLVETLAPGLIAGIKRKLAAAGVTIEAKPPEVGATK